MVAKVSKGGGGNSRPAVVGRPAISPEDLLKAALDVQRYRCLVTASQENPSEIEGELAAGVLALLLLEGRPLSNSDIRTRFNKKNAQYVGKVIKKLKRAELCERVGDDPDDERRKFHKITPKGKEQIDLYLSWSAGIQVLSKIGEKYRPDKRQALEHAEMIIEGLKDHLLELKVLKPPAAPPPPRDKEIT